MRFVVIINWASALCETTRFFVKGQDLGEGEIHGGEISLLFVALFILLDKNLSNFFSFQFLVSKSYMHVEGKSTK